jgi:hypothetical protein
MSLLNMQSKIITDDIKTVNSYGITKTIFLFLFRHSYHTKCQGKNSGVWRRYIQQNESKQNITESNTKLQNISSFVLLHSAMQCARVKQQCGIACHSSVSHVSVSCMTCMTGMVTVQEKEHCVFCMPKQICWVVNTAHTEMHWVSFYNLCMHCFIGLIHMSKLICCTIQFSHLYCLSSFASTNTLPNLWLLSQTSHI